MPSLQNITNNTWSDAKKHKHVDASNPKGTCASDILRDKWHISKHLGDFLKKDLGSPNSYRLAGEIIRKLDTYFDKLKEAKGYDEAYFSEVRNVGSDIANKLLEYRAQFEEVYDKTEFAREERELKGILSGIQ